MKIAETGAPPLKELTPKKEAGHVSRLLLDWYDLYSSFALVHFGEKNTACSYTLPCLCYFSMLSRVPRHSSKLWLQKYVESECGCQVGRDSKVGEIGSGEKGVIKA